MRSARLVNKLSRHHQIQAESKSFCHGLHEFHGASLDFVKIRGIRGELFGGGQTPLRVSLCLRGFVVNALNENQPPGLRDSTNAKIPRTSTST
jgi:hypothetical protein